MPQARPAERSTPPRMSTEPMLFTATNHQLLDRRSVFLAKIRVTLKPTVNDPQGKTIAQALGRLSFDTVESVRAGKYFEVKLNDSDRAIAEKRVREICEKLLANPVIERYEFDLSPLTERAQV